MYANLGKGHNLQADKFMTGLGAELTTIGRDEIGDSSNYPTDRL